MQKINKFLIILLMILITIFSFSNISYGASLIVDNYDMSDIYNYFSNEEAFFIVKTGSRYLFYMPINNKYKKYCAIKNNYIAYFSENWYSLEGNNYKFYYFNTDTKKFEFSWEGAYDSFKYNAYPIVYASKGIYNTDHKTFFVNPPAPKLTLVEILAEALEEMIQVIIMNTKTIITVGLIVLGIGLMIYLVKLVISQSQ